MEKLLVFHLDDNNLKKLKQITGALKVRVEEVPSSDYLKPLEMIANKTASPLIQSFSGKVPAESLIVFCDFTEKKMDKLLASLRRDQVVIDYKAVLTPTNRKWNVMRMYLEMQAEKAAYQKNKA